MAGLGMVPVKPALHVPEVTDLMDEHGRFRSPSLQSALDEMLTEVEWFARVLTPARAMAAS